MIKLTLANNRGPIRINPQYVIAYHWAIPAGADESFIPSTTLVIVNMANAEGSNTMMEVLDSIESIDKQMISGEVLPWPTPMGLNKDRTPDLPEVRE